jgi:hypothetical protein
MTNQGVISTRSWPAGAQQPISMTRTLSLVQHLDFEKPRTTPIAPQPQCNATLLQTIWLQTTIINALISNGQARTQSMTSKTDASANQDIDKMPTDDCKLRSALAESIVLYDAPAHSQDISTSSRLLIGGPLLSGQAPALAGEELGVPSINPRATTTPRPQLLVRPTGDHLLNGGPLLSSQAPVLAGEELGVPSINPRVPTPAQNSEATDHAQPSDAHIEFDNKSTAPLVDVSQEVVDAMVSAKPSDAHTVFEVKPTVLQEDVSQEEVEAAIYAQPSDAHNEFENKSTEFGNGSFVLLESVSQEDVEAMDHSKPPEAHTEFDNNYIGMPMTTMPSVDALQFASWPLECTYFELRDAARVAQASTALHTASWNIGELSMHVEQLFHVNPRCKNINYMVYFSPSPPPPLKPCCNTQYHKNTALDDSSQFDEYECMDPYLSDPDSEQMSNRRIGDLLNSSVIPSKQGGCSVKAEHRMSMPCPVHTSKSRPLRTH